MVETFLVKEAEELIHDSDKLDEWKVKCEELGLVNQLYLAQPEKSPIPFECMNEIQRRVYGTICPAKVKYQEYKRTAIPLEVLSLIALSKHENYFERIDIWYNDKDPDPIAVGVIKEDSYTEVFYLIARWGHELMSFEKLRDAAIVIYKRTTLISLKTNLASIEDKIRNIDVNVDAYFDCQIDSYRVSNDYLF